VPFETSTNPLVVLISCSIWFLFICSVVALSRIWLYLKEQVELLWEIRDLLSKRPPMPPVAQIIQSPNK
jgi:hypothetical protein